MTRGEECLECHRFDSALCLHCLLEFDPPPTKSYNIGAIFLLKDQEIKFKEKIGSHSDPSQKPRAGLESREPWFSLSSALQTIQENWRSLVTDWERRVTGEGPCCQVARVGVP